MGLSNVLIWWLIDCPVMVLCTYLSKDGSNTLNFIDGQTIYQNLACQENVLQTNLILSQAHVISTVSYNFQQQVRICNFY